MKIHPAADIFPMMTEDELKGLAADIKANGLQTPITTWVDEKGDVDRDAKGTEYLLDGRNRQAACKLAGVKPTVAPLTNGHDPVAFILSANIARRHMLKGQQAMAVAMIYPEPSKGHSRKKGLVSKNETRLVHSGLLSQARTVLKYLPEEAKKVLAGTQMLGKAYEMVQSFIAASDSDEGRLEALEEQAADLAEFVKASKMPLSEAYGAFEQRKRDQEAVEGNKREGMYRISESGYQSGLAWASPEFVAEVKERLDDKEFCAQLIKRLRFDRHEISNFAKGAKAFTAILGQLAKKGK